MSIILKENETMQDVVEKLGFTSEWVYEIAPIAYWYENLHENGRIKDIHFSRRMREMLGYKSAEEFPDAWDTLMKFTHPDDVQIMLQGAIDAGTGKTDKYDVQYRIRKADGSYLWCNATGQLIRNHDGVVVGMYGAFIDISEEIELLQEQEKRRHGKELINSFAKDYEATFLGNLQDGSYTVLSNKSPLYGFFQGNNTLPEAFKAYFEHVAHPIDRERIEKERYTQEEIRDNFAVGDTHSLEYRRKIGDAYYWYRVAFNRINEDEILVGFVNCDREHTSKLVNEKLMSEYDAIYIVSLDRGRIRAARSSRVSSVGAFTDDRDYRPTVLEFAETVDSKYRQDWIHFSNPEYVKQYMAVDDHREYVYELPGAGRTMRRLSIDVIERIGGEARSVLVSFMGIDDARAQAIRLQRQMVEQGRIINSLSEDFSCVNYVELTDDPASDQAINYRTSEILVKNIPGWEQEKGFTSKLGLMCDYLVYEPDRERFIEDTRRETVFRELEGKNAYFVNTRMLIGGQISYYQLKFSPIRDEHGTPFGMVFGLHSIDEQVRRELEQQEKMQKSLELANQQRYIKAFGDMVNAALWKMTINDRDEVIDVNWSNELRRMFGFEETLEDFPNTLEAWADRLHPDDKKRVLDIFYSGFKSTDTEHYVSDLEYRILRKNGEYCWYHAVGRMEYNDDGIRKFYGIIFDISQDKQIEEQQRQLEAALAEATLANRRNDALHEAVKSGQWSFVVEADNKTVHAKFSDELKRIIHCNLNSDPYSWMELLHPDDREQAGKAFMDALFDPECRIPYDDTYRLMGNDGAYRWFNSAGKKIRRPDGTCELFGMFVDVTDQMEKEREQQEQLQEALAMAQSASRAKTTFLNNMSHDIRTPMNAIIGFTGLAASHIDNREQVKDYLTKIGQASNHLLSLINDVLDMSRIESGKMNLDEKEENLTDILHTLRSIVQSDIHSKQLDFYVDAVDVNDETVICDKLRLNQVLLNILSNAIKYTHAGGTVALRVTEKAVKSNGYATYEFIVKDNGMGMEKEFLKTIYEPFTRVRSSTVSGIQGTGLGMAITKNIIDMMGGTIVIESEPGKGTDVTISFDFKLQDAPREPVQIPELEGLRALVVDDDSNTCLSVSGMLRDIGMHDEWCTSGKEAVIRAEEAFRRGDVFKVYIIDWLMPDMNGIETTRRIRKVIGDNVPIIILTSYDWSDIEDEAREAGVTAFVSKPMFPSDLHKVLNSCLGKQVPIDEVQKNEYDFTGRKALLVEDNELNREIATELLTENGFIIETAEDGTRAVDLVKENGAEYYDFILMDIQMPGMDGYEATKAIRAMYPDAKLPIIALSANAFAEDKDASLAAGMNDHVAKPIKIKELFAALAKFL